MPFIGQQPVTGAYHKLDAITASATATYNLLLNGGAYSPASANHLLVSLNGVMQAPQDSFTVSGSTITFASALTSSDNIDFIMALGDVLNIGTPSDGTVTAGKIASGAVTDAKIASGAVTDAKIAGMAASKLTGALPAIDGSNLTGITSGKLLQTLVSSRVGNIQITSTSFQEISTSMRVSITIENANSILLFTCPLYTEVDTSTGHGLAVLQYSTDGGSTFTSYDSYNITGAPNDSIGYGFTDFWDHSFSAGATVMFRVSYRTSSSGGNHTIADVGPGESPAAYLLVQEVLS